MATGWIDGKHVQYEIAHGHSEELKPCPFCGGEAELYVTGGDVTTHCVGCLADCEAGCTTGGDSRKEATRIWNHRAWWL